MCRVKNCSLDGFIVESLYGKVSIHLDKNQFYVLT